MKIYLKNWSNDQYIKERNKPTSSKNVRFWQELEISEEAELWAFGYALWKRRAKEGYL